MRYSIYSLTSPLDRLYECFDCGSAVNNKDKHDNFHNQIDDLEHLVDTMSGIINTMRREVLHRTY